MEFSEFCSYVEDIEDTSGNKMIHNVAELFSDANGDALEIVPLFIQGNVFSVEDDRKTGVGSSLLLKAISDVTGTDVSELESTLPEVKDVGGLFENINYQQVNDTISNSNSLSVSELYSTLEDIAETSGRGSQSRKVNMISSILSRCEDNRERRYAAKIILEEMRIGVGEGVVRKAISESFGIDEESVERAMMLTNDAGKVAIMSQKHTDELLSKIEINIGDGIKPMLAQKSEINSLFDDLGTEVAIAQTKFDGARLQIHKNKDEIKAFTRNLEEISDSIPDIVSLAQKAISAEKAVIDSEVVGYDSQDSTEPLRFQEVLKRLRRKYNIEEKSNEIVLDIHAFDILYSGEHGSLLDTELSQRIDVLSDVVDDSILADAHYVTSATEVKRINKMALNSGHEGLVVKGPNSTYEPNNRGKKWLKIKPEVETIDAVVTGGTWGKGERQSLIASYDLSIFDEEGSLQPIGKIGTGLTEGEMEQLTEHFKPKIVSQVGRQIEFENETVVEVAFEEVQPSMEYESGYALRFPRFVSRRNTLSIDDADSLNRLKSIIDD